MHYGTVFQCFNVVLAFNKKCFLKRFETITVLNTPTTKSRQLIQKIAKLMILYSEKLSLKKSCGKFLFKSTNRDCFFLKLKTVLFHYSFIIL